MVEQAAHLRLASSDEHGSKVIDKGMGVGREGRIKS